MLCGSDTSRARFAHGRSGTYDKTSNTGGSDGGTIWRAAEAADPENKGLDKARKWLKAMHARHSWTTLADLAILSAYVAIEASGGPHIPFSYGRRDFSDAEAQAKHGPSGCPFGDGKINPNGSRLPAADLGPAKGCPHHAPAAEREKPTIDAVRGTFRRLGFDDKAAVNLIILGHQYGRCHPENSGASPRPAAVADADVDVAMLCRALPWPMDAVRRCGAVLTAPRLANAVAQGTSTRGTPLARLNGTCTARAASGTSPSTQVAAQWLKP
jgi:catalase (peroxidase I)